ncbi:hypothetical protein HID58_009362 [Brassica napus]|uniref:Uncharacterized protein n=1 Tax=Brassica napus TaxID=3708 RepID=A0ABQ8DUU5_BRANA|nr:hypothetical protein HID58_009362 [Brassica napus]
MSILCKFRVGYDHGSLATSIASGVSHEVLYVYLTRETPTGEVAWFFVLHVVCTVVEVLVKKKTFVGRLRVRPIVSRLLTVGFVCVTAGWLFYPQLIRNNDKYRTCRQKNSIELNN